MSDSQDAYEFTSRENQVIGKAATWALALSGASFVMVAAGHSRAVLTNEPDGARGADREGARDVGVPAGHPGPPLPARRCDPVRGFPRRFLRALSRSGAPSGCGVHSVLRGPLHGGERGHSDEARADRDAAKPGGGLFDGGHGGPGRRLRLMGRAHRDRLGGERHPDHVHELGRRSEGVRGQERRRGLHLE